MAKNEEFIKVIKSYEENFSQAYLKLSDYKDNKLKFNDILHASILSQNEYGEETRDIRNVFLTNTLHKNNIIGFDDKLPKIINLWEYYLSFKEYNKEIFDTNIFGSPEQLENFIVSFMTRFFNGDLSKFSFFDKIIINTLIKSRLLVRTDSSSENLEPHVLFQD